MSGPVDVLAILAIHGGLDDVSAAVEELLLQAEKSAAYLEGLITPDNWAGIRARELRASIVRAGGAA